ncbi:MAG: phosphodiester glycosidase family protein [Cyanobacteria bacterium J06659_2]
MRRVKGGLGLVGGLVLGLALVLGLRFFGLADVPIASMPSSSTQTDTVVASSSPELAEPVQYEAVTLPRATVHLLTIPVERADTLQVGISDTLQTVSQWGSTEDTLAVLNAGFFDPQNGQTTSYVTIAGELVADPRDNPRLMNNPDLAPYLGKILNRSEFRRLNCGEGIRYVIAAHNTPLPANCTLIDAVGAGPQLLPTDTAFEEGFIDFNQAGEISRDALGSRSLNARTAVGIKANGDVVWAMVAQRPDGASPSGMTLGELAEFLSDQGAAFALNLDGGSSSTLYFDGTTHHGRWDAGGNPIQRAVKSVLQLTRSQP